MNIIILLEKYPSEEANKILDIIKDSGLNECVQLKYINDYKYVKTIHITELDDILKTFKLQSSSKDDYTNNSISNRREHDYDMSNQRLSSTNDYVIVFGRKGRYFVRRELYDALKQGISLRELRERYNDKVYNLVMNMYSDGIIIMSNGKMWLID